MCGAGFVFFLSGIALTLHFLRYFKPDKEVTLDRKRRKSEGGAVLEDKEAIPESKRRKSIKGIVSESKGMVMGDFINLASGGGRKRD